MVQSAPEPIRVLLIDDEEEHYEITRALLTNAERTMFDLDWVTTYGEAVEAIARGRHDIYLVDYFLEDRTGLDLVREVNRQTSPRPVIMLTGKGDRRVDLEAMRSGAADYLIKGRIDPPTLERSIRYALERHGVKEALRQSEARSRHTFEHLPIGLFRIGLDGEFMEANPALRDMLGYPGDDLLRNGFARDFFVASEDRGLIRREIEQSGGIRGAHSELRRADGSTVAVRVSVWRCDPDGDETGYYEGTVEMVFERRSSAVPDLPTAGVPRLP